MDREMLKSQLFSRRPSRVFHFLSLVNICSLTLHHKRPLLWKQESRSLLSAQFDFSTTGSSCCVKFRILHIDIAIVFCKTTEKGVAHNRFSVHLPCVTRLM